MSTYIEYFPCLRYCVSINNTSILHMNDLTQFYSFIIIISILQLRKLSHREASYPQITKLERVAAGIYTCVCVTPNTEPSRAPYLYFSLTRIWKKKKTTTTSFLPVSLKWWPNEWLSLRAGYSSFTKL